jgi:signal transduction histidine kinase
MALQGLDSANDEGPAAVAEFLSALCGSAGGVLFAVTGLLSATAERNAADRRSGPGAEGYRRVLLALPAIGFVAGTLLAAAVALMIVRGMLGTELPFVVVLIGLYLVLLWLAASTVMRATRVLYAHAQLEAQDAADARVAAGEARLSALQARMNPHFLFNALNTVASLVRTEPAAAERVTENLSDVLRMTLARSAERMSTVGDEVDYLRAWLAVEEERWKGLLRVDWRIAPDTLPAAIPPLVLQPLVENSLRHGLGGRMDGGTITISTARTPHILCLRVADDGVGFAAAYEEGTGLGNLRQRLAAIYGDRAVLRVEPSSGATVVVEIPYEGADARAGRG